MLSAVQSIGQEEWTQTHEIFKYICRKMGVKRAGRRNCWSGQGGVGAMDGEGTVVLSNEWTGCYLEQKVGTLFWKRGTWTYTTTASEAHVTAEGSEGSNVSFDLGLVSCVSCRAFFADEFFFPRFLLSFSRNAWSVKEWRWCVRQNRSNHSHPLCSSCKHFPKDDFIWWVTENHREQKKNVPGVRRYSQ